MKRVDRTAIAGSAISLALTILLVALAGETLTFLAVSAAVYGVLALSLVPTIGGVGLLPLSQLMFAAIGAIVVGWVADTLPFLLAVAVVAGGGGEGAEGVAGGVGDGRFEGVGAGGVGQQRRQWGAGGSSGGGHVAEAVGPDRAVGIHVGGHPHPLLRRGGGLPVLGCGGGQDPAG